MVGSSGDFVEINIEEGKKDIFVVPDLYFENGDSEICFACLDHAVEIRLILVK
jgi:hypothetical protein